MCPDSEEKNTPSDGESVEIAEDNNDWFTWPPHLFEAGAAANGNVKVKCSKEKKVTSQSDLNIMPAYMGEMTPEKSLEILKISKRLTLCHSCGNLSLTN